MKLARALACAFALITLALPSAAPAQEPPPQEQRPASGSGRFTPAAGTWAVGADLAFSNPIGDDDFDAEPLLDAYGEYFFTRHASFRGTLGFLSFDDPDLPPSFRGEVDIFMVLGDVLYEWEGAIVHPFIMGGVGLYNYDADAGDEDLEFGLNFGGGANIYITRRFAIKLEGTFHGTTASEPDSFFNAGAGARWLF